MKKRFWLATCLTLVVVLAFRPKVSSAQETQPEFRVTVNMVQLNVAVTDKKGNYVTGLRPENFEIVEDGIREKIATFGEGDNPARRVVEATASGGPAESRADPAVDALETPASGPLTLAQFQPGRFQRIRPVRHQQLHVSRFCLRAGCHR